MEVLLGMVTLGVVESVATQLLPHARLFPPEYLVILESPDRDL
jgi:hypothetical protein